MIDSANDPVWRKLEKFEFDRDPTAPFLFAHRIAKRNNWSLEYSKRVIEETRKFLYLAYKCGHMVTPSTWIDEVWHIALMHTNTYWVRMCNDIFNVPIHHSPGDGSVQDEDKFTACYDRTRNSDYVQYFGEPPEDIWGQVHARVDWREVLNDKPRGKPATMEGLSFIGETSLVDATLNQQEVWDRMANFRFDPNPDAPYTFRARVTKRNGWTPEFTELAVQEYLKFIYLYWLTDGGVAPSRWIDEVHHIHLLYTESYWINMCRDTLGKAIHHQPGNGTPQGIADNAARFARVFDVYPKVFGCDPPAEAWGRPEGSDWRRLLLWVPAPAKMKLDVLDMFPHDSDEATP